ncbi:MAG TPA: hypothetical protein VFQ67_05770 [Allosphingosinicella sp.]|jgi:hypothetical protein|nr:hypothetical protein [Allosphingosinicella sp.]
MRHLSIVLPGVFFNAFMIFTISQILVQIAGHAEIVALSNSGELPPAIADAIKLLSLGSLPITFLALLWLELYQVRVYRCVHDRLPQIATRRHGAPALIIGCTVASIFVSVIEHALEGYEWVFVIETALAMIVIVSTFRGQRLDHVATDECE